MMLAAKDGFQAVKLQRPGSGHRVQSLHEGHGRQRLLRFCHYTSRQNIPLIV